VPEGHEVVVPTFCCAAVLPGIRAMGALPVLADVGENLTLTPDTLRAVLSPRTRAVIVPHLFGSPAPIEDITEICRPRGIAVIDDAAQALGGTLDDRPLGSFGDAGVLSFGRGKICFGTGGGALISRCTDVVKRAHRVPLARGRPWETVQRAMAVLLWRRWRRWSLPVEVALSRMGLRKRSAVRPYVRDAMRNADAAVAVTLLDTLETNLRARRARIDRYQAVLGGTVGLDLVLHGAGSACLTQVVRLKVGDGGALAVVNTLRRAGVEVQRSYEPLHLQPAYRGLCHGGLKTAERIWSHLVELPCEPSIPLSDIEWIGRITRDTVTGLKRNNGTK
jgi:dTDP-4-amino-4,6-dideoxygalactose transaminase